MTNDDPCPNRRYEPLVPKAWSEAEVIQLLRDDPPTLWHELTSVFYSPTLCGEFKFNLVEMLLPLGDIPWRAWVWSAAGFHVREAADCCSAAFYELARTTLLRMDDESEHTEEAGSLTDTLGDLITFNGPDPYSSDGAWRWYRCGEAWQTTIALNCLTAQEDVKTVLGLIAAEVNSLDPIRRATAAGGLSDLVTRRDVRKWDLQPHLPQYLALLVTFDGDSHWYVRSAARTARSLYEFYAEDDAED